MKQFNTRVIPQSEDLELLVSYYEDKEIYNCIYGITQYEDVDGRYFRDCEYNYGMLFGKVDAALYKDYEIVKEMMDD